MNSFVTYLKLAGMVVAALVLTKVAFFVLHLTMSLVRMTLWIVVWGFIFIVLHHLFFKKRGPGTPADS